MTKSGICNIRLKDIDTWQTLGIRNCPSLLSFKSWQWLFSTAGTCTFVSWCLVQLVWFLKSFFGCPVLLWKSIFLVCLWLLYFLLLIDPFPDLMCFTCVFLPCVFKSCNSLSSLLWPCVFFLLHLVWFRYLTLTLYYQPNLSFCVFFLSSFWTFTICISNQLEF